MMHYFRSTGVWTSYGSVKRLGMDENTIVILSSDNGAVIDDGYKDQAVELLGEHKATGVYRVVNIAFMKEEPVYLAYCVGKGKSLPVSRNS